MMLAGLLLCTLHNLGIATWHNGGRLRLALVFFGLGRFICPAEHSLTRLFRLSGEDQRNQSYWLPQC